MRDGLPPAAAALEELVSLRAAPRKEQSRRASRAQERAPAASTQWERAPAASTQWELAELQQSLAALGRRDAEQVHEQRVQQDQRN